MHLITANPFEAVRSRLKNEAPRATSRRRRNPPPMAKPNRKKASGISNQPVDAEKATQARVPSRGIVDEPSWTRDVEGTEEGELLARTVADVMTSAPTALEAARVVSDAARAMRDSDIGDVLVTEEGRLIGIMTDRDVVVRVLGEGLDPASTSLGAVCSRELTTVGPGDAIETAAARMRERAVRRVPVVEDGRPVGIVALGDLAVEREPESVLGTISAAPATR
jgi:CBS domain-containing protein